MAVKNKPTKPGYYWFRHDSDYPWIVVYIKMKAERFSMKSYLSVQLGDLNIKLENFKEAEFSNRIIEPGEPGDTEK